MIGNLLLLKSKNVLYIDYGSKNIHILNILGILFEKVFFTDNNKDAKDLYEDESPDLIISNIKLSPLNGIKFIRHIREYDYKIPIIILTEKHDDNLYLDIANLSVDASLCDPFANEIFINTLCRSIKRNFKESGLITLNQHLIFNFATKKLYSNGVVVTLGAKENQFLQLLIENRSRTLTKEEIEKKLWPLDSISDSALKKMIHRIRQKMKTNIIISVRGVGYRLDTQVYQRTQQKVITNDQQYVTAQK